jgi:hypothetical protein
MQLNFILFSEGFHDTPEVWLNRFPPSQNSPDSFEIADYPLASSAYYFFDCSRAVPLVRHYTIGQLMVQTLTLRAIQPPDYQVYLLPATIGQLSQSQTPHCQRFRTYRATACPFCFYEKIDRLVPQGGNRLMRPYPFVPPSPEGYYTLFCWSALFLVSSLGASRAFRSGGFWTAGGGVNTDTPCHTVFSFAFGELATSANILPLLGSGATSAGLRFSSQHRHK